MRLVAAELLKMRRRQMTYVLPMLLMIVMTIVLLLVGSFVAPLLRSLATSGLDGSTFGSGLPFNVAYSIAGDFVFGLGSLLFIIYVGAIVGGDYSWGVLRNAFSRGESRINYALGKAAALAIGVTIAAAIALVLGILMVLLIANDARIDLGSPLSADAMTDFVKALGLGLLVLFERGAIGFAVAVLLRSQVAGIVVGVILYIAEPFVAGLAATFSSIGSAFDPNAAPSIHWSQYLPFTIGSSVLAEGHASIQGLTADSGLTTVVPIEQALPVLIVYGIIAMAFACFVMRRQEIVG
jgi:ABC-type transport system involved in multi-copper enzyme maturation permease subunit